MELRTSKQDGSFDTSESAFDRRRDWRVGGSCGLTFSGVDGRQFMMGDGQVMDLSEDGIGVRGDRPVKAGMDLALFIELPGSEDHLCIPHARVSWVKGRRFGVALGALNLKDQHRLQFFLWTASTDRQPVLTRSRTGE
jgi:PilZ domain